MALQLRDCSFFGPALPEPFVKFQLEKLLITRKLLPKATGPEAKQIQARWDVYRRFLRNLGEQGGELRVANHVLEPLAERLGYLAPIRQQSVVTREGPEDGGWLFLTSDASAKLRGWSVALGTDLDAPNRRGRAYRFSPTRVAQRVLLASGERAGLITDGEELRLLVCDPSRPDSHIAIRLDRTSGWRSAREAPDSYRLLLALAAPKGLAALAELTEEARLSQTSVTAKLRQQARRAVEEFVQELLDNPVNKTHLPTDPEALARTLWHEGLIIVYRLLFLFKLESSVDHSRSFSFASASLWRHTYSPNSALAPFARRLLDQGHDTGRVLEDGLRSLFRLFRDGLQSSELKVSPLGGALFGEAATPLLDRLAWGERAVAKLLDHLLWTPAQSSADRERVYYGPLDVEDLGRVYEALLELEPGLSSEPVCRLRRDKLEVVVPAAQGAAYRDAKKAKVEWIEDIPPGRFYLRVGLGRKASGSYYTPHPFVRFLVQETLGPQLQERSPSSDPNPSAILNLKVLDPAMGSGHFLVEACRYLGDALYESCRLCDELAVQLEEQAEQPKSDKAALLSRAADLRTRVQVLPDPDDELLAYLPSRVPEGEQSGLSQRRAEAICRRLIAVHCLYGVDKNPLAVELAKLSLWLESYAEGLPLTFLDHRLVCGDSLTGPFFEHLLTYPGSGQPLSPLTAQGLSAQLTSALRTALVHVHDLESTVGKDVADLEHKHAAKSRLDHALSPFRLLAKAWSGGVALGKDCDDSAYEHLAKVLLDHSAKRPDESLDHPSIHASSRATHRMLTLGADSISYDLTYPEIFHPTGAARTGGFDVVLGNPPWDAIQPKAKEFLASYDLTIVDATTKRERQAIEDRILSDTRARAQFDAYRAEFDLQKSSCERLYEYQRVVVGDETAKGQLDQFRVFGERSAQLACRDGYLGLLVPSGFHANAGATGIRRLFLTKMRLVSCYSFENLRRLFDIDSRFKFATLVVRKEAGGTKDFNCAFYLHDLDWLFAHQQPLNYSYDFVRETGGEYLTLLEMRSVDDADVARQCYDAGEAFGALCHRVGVALGRECHMTDDSFRFVPTLDILPNGDDPRDPLVHAQLLARGYLPLHEGKTFHQYDDQWGAPPHYLVPLTAVADKTSWLEAARHYRLAYRKIARSTDERTAHLTLIPPGFLFGDGAPSERSPGARPAWCALAILAVANSFSFDWAARQKTSANINTFILESCPAPKLPGPLTRMLVHNALRLCCRHHGFAPLWRSELGGQFREVAGSSPTQPTALDEETRRSTRALIDAAVAHAFTLTRAHYSHVLSTFSHRSHPDAPALCLKYFDEAASLGIDAFIREHDPFRDVPLNDALPKPNTTLKTQPTAEGQPQAAKVKKDRRTHGRQQSLFDALRTDDGPLGEEP